MRTFIILLFSLLLVTISCSKKSSVVHYAQKEYRLKCFVYLILREDGKYDFFDTTLFNQKKYTGNYSLKDSLIILDKTLPHLSGHQLVLKHSDNHLYLYEQDSLGQTFNEYRKRLEIIPYPYKE